MAKPENRRAKKIVLPAIAVAATAILVAVLASGFSFGGVAQRPANPFGPGEGPPKIILANEGREYQGKLLGYTYSNQETISDLPDISLANITSISKERAINVTKGSTIRFEVEGNPAPEAQFDSLAVTAYAKDGQPAGLLDARGDPQDNVYAIDRLESGNEYILFSTATWTPEGDRERVSGYVVYGFRISVN